MKQLLYIVIFLMPIHVAAQSIFISATDTTICPNSRVIFTATTDSLVFPHYEWQVNGLNLGIDTNKLVIDTISEGDIVMCLYIDSLGTILALSDTIFMTVHTKPSAGIITGKDTVCEGSSIGLSASVLGGNWFVRGSHASIDSYGVFKGISGFSEFEMPCTIPYFDTAYYVVSNIYCTDTTFKRILIYNQPNPGFSLFDGRYTTNRLCVNGSLLLNDGEHLCGIVHSAFGMVYVHSGINFGISGKAAGRDSLYSIITNYCGARSYSEIVYVLDKPALPEITALKTNVCVGDSITLSTLPLSNAGPQWYRSNTNVITSENHSPSITVYGLNAGLDTISVRNSNSCGETKRESIVIAVDSTPVIDSFNTNVCKGAIAFLTSNMANGVWSSSNSNVNINSDGLLTGIDTGEAWISYLLNNGCFAKEKISVVDCPDIVQIFPNPVHDKFVLHITMTAKYSYYTLVDILGRVLFTKPISGEYTTINAANLTPGLYFVTLNGRATRTSKFVKE